MAAMLQDDEAGGNQFDDASHFDGHLPHQRFAHRTGTVLLGEFVLDDLDVECRVVYRLALLLGPGRPRHLVIDFIRSSGFHVVEQRYLVGVYPFRACSELTRVRFRDELDQLVVFELKMVIAFLERGEVAGERGVSSESVCVSRARTSKASLEADRTSTCSLSEAVSSLRYATFSVPPIFESMSAFVFPMMILSI
jgi:hypothetical protein